jgi:heme-degrading monooxygenase HmoA
MALVSLTRLKLRSPRFFFPFAWYAWQSIRQARSSPGFIRGQTGRDRNGGAWTITVWQDMAAMRNFRNTASHMAAMPKLLHWCCEASIANWEQEHDELPNAEDAFDRMSTIGKISKVYHPTEAHSNGKTVGERPPRINYRFNAAAQRAS